MLIFVDYIGKFHCYLNFGRQRLLICQYQLHSHMAGYPEYFMLWLWEWGKTRLQGKEISAGLAKVSGIWEERGDEEKSNRAWKHITYWVSGNEGPSQNAYTLYFLPVTNRDPLMVSHQGGTWAERRLWWHRRRSISQINMRTMSRWGGQRNQCFPYTVCPSESP